MRTIQGVRVGWLVGAVGACILVAGAARADVATERPGSILIFPKVVRDGTRDTVIQIGNTGNMPNTVRCFYLDGETFGGGQPVCAETDFNFTLTRQQPIHWRVSQGRRVDPTDPFGSEGAGLDPGAIPPVGFGFTGALVCVEVGMDDFLPVGQSKLKGEATIEGIAGNPADESKYNAIAITPGSQAAPGKDNDLSLDGVEYAACPASMILNFIPDGAADPVIEDLGNGGLCTNNGAACNNDSQCAGTCIGASVCSNGGAPCTIDAQCTGTCSTGQSQVVTRLTVIPCNLDFRNGFYTGLTLNFDVHDEFENDFSGGIRNIPRCWGSFNIGDVSTLRASRIAGGAIQTQYATARITSSQGGPFLAVVESFHQDSVANVAAAASNLHMSGVGANSLIRISDQ